MKAHVRKSEVRLEFELPGGVYEAHVEMPEDIYNRYGANVVKRYLAFGLSDYITDLIIPSPYSKIFSIYRKECARRKRKLIEILIERLNKKLEESKKQNSGSSSLENKVSGE